MPHRRIGLIERLPGQSDDTLAYFIRPGSRSRPWIWFEIEEVPPFEGHSASFEVERIKGGWKVIGRAED